MMESKGKSTAVTKDYGKRTAIVTGSSRGMYGSIQKLPVERDLADEMVVGKQLPFGSLKMDSTSA